MSLSVPEPVGSSSSKKWQNLAKTMSLSVPEPVGSSSSQSLLLKPQLSPHHPLVKLAEAINWSYFEQEFHSQIAGDIGRPQLPTRLLVGLH
jgi:hypothetical protein